MSRSIISFVIFIFGAAALAQDIQQDSAGPCSPNLGSVGNNVVLNLTCQPDKERMIPDERLVLSGRWKGEAGHPSNAMSLLIGRESPSQFRFTILSNIGANTCEVSGVSKVDKSGNAKFIDDDKYGGDPCSIHFNLLPDGKYEITSHGCIGYCGLGAYFDSKYTRGIDYFVLHDVLTEVDAAEFSLIVGSWYDLFVENMASIIVSEDRDGLGADVWQGGVRGMYTLKEGIIMSRDDGYIWAAVLNEDFIGYFSNHPKYLNILPKTIETWRSRFPNAEVMFISDN